VRYVVRYGERDGSDIVTAPLKLGLVGAGKGGTALLELLLEWSDGAVMIVADPQSDAPGLQKARALGIPTSPEHLAVFSHSLDVVLEVTGRPDVLEDLLREKPADVEVIGAASLRFFWTLLQARVEAVRQLRAQLDLAVVLGSSLDPRHQIAVATEKLAQACNVDRAGFLLLDEATGRVTPLAGEFATGESNERLWTDFKRLGHRPLTDLPFVSQAITRRAPIEIEDPASSSLLPSGWADLFGIKSLLVVPMFAEGRSIGVCLLDYCRVPRRFTSEQTALGITLANQVALAIENTGLRRRAEARAEKLRALGALTQLVTSARPGGQVFDEIARAAVTLLEAKTAQVWIDDPALGVLRVSGSCGLDPDGPRLEHAEIPRGQGVISRVFQSRTAEYLLDVQEDPEWLNKRLAQELGLHAYAAIPLMTEERVAGALTILFDARRGFSPEERELMQLLAGQAAVAIENARLFEASERRRRAAEHLTETARVVAQSLDVDEVARRLTRSLCELLDGHSSALFRSDVESGTVRVEAVYGDHVLRVGTVLPDLTGATGTAMRERKPIQVPNHPVPSAWRAIDADIRDRLEQSPCRAVLAVPVTVQDTAIGALSLRARTGRVFTSEEIGLAQALADHAAVALENARLYAEATRRQRLAETLARLAQVITASLDLSDVLDRVARAATALLPDSASSIHVTEGTRLVLHAEQGCRYASQLRRERAFGEGTVGRAALARAPVIIEDVLADPHVVNPAWIRAEGFASLLSLPLVVRDKLVGVLTLFTRHRHRFHPDEVASLVFFGAQAAIAIDNGQLLLESRARLDELQRAQEQLTQAQKMDAVGQLAGGIAHDFNNLLTVIIGRAGIVLPHLHPHDAIVRRDIELIEKTAHRAATLTRQLLAFSRRQVLQPKVVDLNQIVESMGQLLKRLIAEHIEVSTSLAPLLGRVEADPAQIEQILLNLGVNARDAMPHGGRLTIETANVELDTAFVSGHVGAFPGPHVMLAVRDTGVGMSRETLARVFEPFFTTKEVGQGTGLGLSTVYGIVKQSGGYIWAESTPGAGATFTVYLPRVAGERSTVASPASASSTRGWETVLLVEDEPDVRDLLCDTLRAEGYTVLEAANGLEALQVCERNPGVIHLLVTDIVMPVMGGPELASRLTATRGEMPVLYMSGYADPNLGPLHGAEFLQKPMTPHALARKVRELLDQGAAKL
jgi:GAF domain-containing protein